VLRGSLARMSVRGGARPTRPPYRGRRDGRGKERVTLVCAASQAAANSSKPPTCAAACVSTM